MLLFMLLPPPKTHFLPLLLTQRCLEIVQTTCSYKPLEKSKDFQFNRHLFTIYFALGSIIDIVNTAVGETEASET